MKPGPDVSVIVSTIGRPRDLERLLESLELASRGLSVELVVVDQSDDRSCLALLDATHSSFPTRGVTSSRGASLGRNVGASLASGRVLTFPDDNAWYEEGTLRAAMDLFAPDLELLSGIQVTSSGEPSMLRWLPQACQITLRNVQRTAIESGIFVRAEAFHRVGGFNEGIGVGSAGPYQAGEVTDLIVRLLQTGGKAAYDPSVRVVSEDPRQGRNDAFPAKMRGYGRGIGHLYRIHPLPLGQLAYYSGRKLAGAAVRALRGRGDLARADLAWIRGVAEGYRGRLADG